MKARLQDKPDAAAFADLGVWYAGQEQYACATDAFATSLQMEPNQADAPHVAFMFGVSLYFSGNAKEGIAALQQAEQFGYNDIKLHVILATALDASHSTKEAEEEWRAALAFDPESSTALDSLSSDLLAEKDFNGVIESLENPRLLGQRTQQQSLNLAEAYAGSARLDEAASVLRNGLNTSPGSLALANRLADILVQLRRADEAVTVLHLALALHPQDSDAAVHYLETLMSTHSEKALDAAHRLLPAFPQNAKLFYLTGVAEMKGGNLEQARARLEQSLALQPDDALAHEALGIVLAQLNSMPGAKEHLQRAIALGDNDPEVEENLAKVLRALGAGK
jgi:Flp pilus assembly protein TadD